MNVLLLTSHAIAEYDDLRMFTDLGYNVFSIGGAYDEVPFEGKRPALEVRTYPELVDATNRVRETMAASVGDPGPNIDWGKARLADEVIDWADVIIVHHFPESWIGGQWDAIKDKRVIWRTCGQSDPRLEYEMSQYRREGLEIVRYSPAEQRGFERKGVFAGQDAVIRFGKYPLDYQPWAGEYPFYVGDWPVIGNITQDMKKRGDACGYDRWLADTGQMLVRPAGPGSEEMHGMGTLSYEDMLVYLRRIRVYLYTGTQPASYTLGLIEAMMSGVPVVPHGWTVPSIEWMWLQDLWEANDILCDRSHPDTIPDQLRGYLDDKEYAARRGQEHRERAIELFGIEKIGAEWARYLG